MKKILNFVLSAYSILSHSEPVQHDIDGAHIIVLRPMDSFSSNKSFNEKIDDNIKDRVGAYNYKKDDKTIPGYPALLTSLNKDPLVQRVNKALIENNFKLYFNATVFQIQKPSTLKASDFPILAENQQKLYEQFIIQQGNPEYATMKTSLKKFIGGVLSVGSLAVIGNEFGMNTAQAALNAKIPDDIYRVATMSKGAVVPLIVPDFDPSQYQSLDVRRITTLGNDDRFGQIIIAYKSEKTPELEEEALTKAIVSMLGADTTLTAVQESQKRDFERRKAIWESNNHD